MKNKVETSMLKIDKKNFFLNKYDTFHGLLSSVPMYFGLFYIVVNQKISYQSVVKKAFP